MAPTPDEVRQIVALRDPLIRNLRITECYYRLSLAFTDRTGRCANWCTFATWASRQAGRTIRGEDFLAALASLPLRFHPVHALWRALLRRGLLYPETQLGRLVKSVHTPFDALERASDAVARGNRKVFEEIGYEFARYTQSDDLDRFLSGLQPEQELLKRAFTRYHRQSAEPDPAARAAMIFLANVEIGLHEQKRLQPEIQEALEAVPATAEDLHWALRPFGRFSRRFTRRFITESLMVLALPGVTLALGRAIDRHPSELLAEIVDPECRKLIDCYGTCDPEDWANLDQRMGFILPLFRAFHDCSDLLECPFTPAQVESMYAGRVPAGQL